MNNGKRALETVLSALLAVLILSTAVVPSHAVTREEIDSLKEWESGLQKRRAALREQIDDYSADLSDAMQQKALLDEEISVIEEEVENLEAQIDAYSERIAVTEADLADAERREAEKYEQFRQRVRAMEEQGRMSYWTILFRATSFVDFLTRLDFVSEIMEADQRVMDELRALQEEIAEKREELRESKRGLESASAERLVKKSELDVQRESANQLIISLEEQRAGVEESMDDVSAEAEAVQEEILRLSAELERQEAEERARREAEERARREREEAEARARQEAEARAEKARRDAEAYRSLRESVSAKLDDFEIQEGGGGYAWPVSSRRITSKFGGRASPGGIGSTNHKGVDIGGVGYGSAVHAAKSGTVIISQYSNSYGNFVVISHGDGNSTLYAHMSARLVSVGDYVVQGETIGKTGSTGHSTGPHLHFEITENGTRINPLIYLDGYRFS